MALSKKLYWYEYLHHHQMFHHLYCQKYLFFVSLFQQDLKINDDT